MTKYLKQGDNISKRFEQFLKNDKVTLHELEVKSLFCLYNKYWINDSTKTLMTP